MSADGLLRRVERKGCESFTGGPGRRHEPAPIGTCISWGGRSVDARYGADKACWPCIIHDALGHVPSDPNPFPRLRLWRWKK